MLERTRYRDSAGAFSFDRLACLRNEYAHNDCSLCLEQCAHNAFVIREGKWRLDEASCTQCGACIGACPTNALSLYGFSLEEAKQKVFKEEKISLTCKDSLPCLGAFSVEVWSVLLLEGKKNLSCFMGECKGCEHNKDGRVEAAIVQRVNEANALVQLLGAEGAISLSYQKEEEKSSRRAFFQRFLAPPKISEDAPMAPLFSLKKALKQSLEKELLVQALLSFIYQKKIDDSCTNCKECVQFCPTQALSYDSAQTKILFQMGKCIGCRICEDICKPKSIHSFNEAFDMVDFAYDTAKVLVSHDLQVCLTCKCAFSYKGGAKICDRCERFEKEHAEFFTLASDFPSGAL